ncbi:MAG: hypothetical protein IBX55_01090 [Methyloprofundus sp.]|nr:hypothetical protein [Methyloprofundus sp.]
MVKEVEVSIVLDRFDGSAILTIDLMSDISIEQLNERVFSKEDIPIEYQKDDVSIFDYVQSWSNNWLNENGYKNCVRRFEQNIWGGNE